jgi:hypothetical protein
MQPSKPDIRRMSIITLIFIYIWDRLFYYGYVKNNKMLENFYIFMISSRSPHYI